MLEGTDHSRQIALVADDDEFFRMALATILTAKLGFDEVIETGSLDEAIERLSDRADVGLALFDLAMPGMEGAASLRAVRECFAELRLGVISSSSSRQMILRALEAGVHGYLPKSLGVAEIPRALQLMIDGIIFVPPSLSQLPLTEEGEPPLREVRDVPAEGLTPRQRDVLRLLVRGHSNKEIARLLGLSEGTVKVHMAAVFRRLGVSSRSAAAVTGAKLLAGEVEPV
jgi:DNA-binding NarL/FixJ family response regulator